MNRNLAVAVLSVGSVLLGTANTVSAAVKTIEARSDGGANAWQPKETVASAGDEVEWKLGSGTHGVRITNWAAVKDHVEVVAVDGQQPFNATTGRNDNSTSTAGKVLLRLKVKSAPPAPGEITFNCIVHGVAMSGKVSVGSADSETKKPR